MEDTKFHLMSPIGAVMGFTPWDSVAEMARRSEGSLREREVCFGNGRQSVARGGQVWVTGAQV